MKKSVKKSKANYEIIQLENGKPKIDVVKALELVTKIPGAKINRKKFLRKELSPYCNKSVVDEAVNKNPAYAKIKLKIINKLADSAIKYERNKVAAISFASGLPGGFAMVPALSADIVLYFYYVIVIIQKLAYLYGFDEFDFDEKDIDSATMNKILIFMGVMMGVNGANEGLKVLSRIIGENMTKKLVKTALTKGTIYPIVKKILNLIGVKITKQIFANTTGKIIPVVGAVVSGSITFVSYGKNCINLKKHLMKNPIANPKFYK